MKKIAIVIAAVAFTTVSAGAKEAPIVIDPVTGVEISVSELDWSTLTDAQKQEVRDQLQALREERIEERKEARRERVRLRLEERTVGEKERRQEMHEEMGGAGGMGGGMRP